MGIVLGSAEPGAKPTTVARNKLRLRGVEVQSLSFGALLHDVGKIGVPDSILLKRGPLNDDEWTVMRRHPSIGRRILRAVPFLGRAVDVVFAD